MFFFSKSKVELVEFECIIELSGGNLLCEVCFSHLTLILQWFVLEGTVPEYNFTEKMPKKGEGGSYPLHGAINQSMGWDCFWWPLHAFDHQRETYFDL